MGKKRDKKRRKEAGRNGGGRPNCLPHFYPRRQTVLWIELSVLQQPDNIARITAVHHSAQAVMADWTMTSIERKGPETHPPHQLLTPDQTMRPNEYKVYECEQQHEPGCRGLRLRPEEELCLVRICKRHMSNYNVSDHPKSFWIEIADVLLRECGRVYSWQSCRRRISTYVTKRKTFRAALDRGLPPPYYDIDQDVAEEVDNWIEESDSRWEALQREKELGSNEQAMTYKEKLRLEHEARRRHLVKRVQDWVDNVPFPEEAMLLPHNMERLSAPNNNNNNNEYPSVPRSRFQSRSRSRSRSPRRPENYFPPNNPYRQRPPPRRPLTVQEVCDALQRNMRKGCSREGEPSGPDTTSHIDRPAPVSPKDEGPDHHKMETAVEEPAPVPITQGNNNSLFPHRESEPVEKDCQAVPEMRTSIDNAFKSASATFSQQMNELAGNPAIQNQNFRLSLKGVESAVNALYQNIGKMVESMVEIATDSRSSETRT